MKFTILVRAFLSLQLGLSLAACAFVADPSTNGINYGRIREMDNMSKFSVSAWIYFASHVAEIHTIAAKFSDPAGWIFYEGNGKLMVGTKGTTLPGNWGALGTQLAVDTWHHVVMTRDISVSGDTPPKLYANGSELTPLTEALTPNSVNADDTDCPFTVGNVYTVSAYNKPFVGSIKNVRVYNDVLTAAQIAAIYALGEAGSPSISSQVFAGPCIKTNDTVLYDGIALTEDLKLLDDMYGAIGTPIDSPTCDIP